MSEENRNQKKITLTPIVVALIGIIPALLAFMLKPEKDIDQIEKESYRQIQENLSNVPGYVNYAYPNLCLGFSAPSSWSLEDAVAEFAGGELNILKRYEETGAAIGTKMRFLIIQKNYINNPELEFKNQLDVYKKIDTLARVHELSIGGRIAKCYTYKQKTGQKYGQLERCFIRITPEVKLEILSFARDDSEDEEEFWGELKMIQKSIYFNEDEINRRSVFQIEK